MREAREAEAVIRQRRRRLPQRFPLGILRHVTLAVAPAAPAAPAPPSSAVCCFAPLMLQLHAAAEAGPAAQAHQELRPVFHLPSSAYSGVSSAPNSVPVTSYRFALAILALSHNNFARHAGANCCRRACHAIRICAVLAYRSPRPTPGPASRHGVRHSPQLARQRGGAGGEERARTSRTARRRGRTPCCW